MSKSNRLGWRHRLAAVASTLVIAAGSLVGGSLAGAAPAAADPGGPQADFTAFCQPLMFPFLSCRLDGGSSTGDIVSWEWELDDIWCDDKVTASGERIHGHWIIGECPRLLEITLTVTDSSDRTDTLVKVIDHHASGEQ